MQSDAGAQLFESLLPGHYTWAGLQRRALRIAEAWKKCLVSEARFNHATANTYLSLKRASDRAYQRWQMEKRLAELRPSTEGWIWHKAWAALRAWRFVRQPRVLFIPTITASHLAVEMVRWDEPVLELMDRGGAFGYGVACLMAEETQPNDVLEFAVRTMGVRALDEALELGLKPLHEGYAHARLGDWKLKLAGGSKRKGSGAASLAPAVDHLLKALTYRQAYCETVQLAAHHLSVVLSALRRQQESDALRDLAARADEQLGRSVDGKVLEETRSLVQRCF